MARARKPNKVSFSSSVIQGIDNSVVDSLVAMRVGLDQISSQQHNFKQPQAIQRSSKQHVLMPQQKLARIKGIHGHSLVTGMKIARTKGNWAMDKLPKITAALLNVQENRICKMLWEWSQLLCLFYGCLLTEVPAKDQE